MKHKKFVVCVDGVYVKGGKIFLLKRTIEPFKGFWHLAGGHVEENETLKEALKREFKEETNMNATIGGRIEETSDRVKIIAAFEITSAEGEIRLSPESDTYGWFDEVPRKSIYNYAKYLPNKNSNPYHDDASYRANRNKG